MLDHNSIRIAEVYRLSLAGLNKQEIVKQIMLDFPEINKVGLGDLIAEDLKRITRWQEEYQDPEKVRTSISLDLDSVFKSIMSELSSPWLGKQSNAKALFYKEARETLLQKALLYGLNSQNLNVNQKGKLWTLIKELRADATELEAEANYPALPEPHDVPVTIAADSGLVVESDSGGGWGAGG